MEILVKGITLENENLTVSKKTHPFMYLLWRITYAKILKLGTYMFPGWGSEKRDLGIIKFLIFVNFTG